MNLNVEVLPGPPVAKRRVELVERKGIGHPDTICDSLVEAISVSLNRLYLDRLGGIPHYNIDKALLVAGECAKFFGRGEMQRPMRFVVGDRATFRAGDRDLPIGATIEAAVDAWVGNHLPQVRPGVDLVTELALAPGSEPLRAIYGGALATASNDTSGTCGYAPLSPTERLVLEVEGYLNGADFKRRFPATGQDVKVFAVREGERVDLTVAMPQLCRWVESEAAYFRGKEEILHDLGESIRAEGLVLYWHLNCLDREGEGFAGTYLTLTGTSAEDADSGQVGRGNRVNGLIPFARPTGGEAAAGKNPVAHVGKIYNVFAYRLAERLQASCPAVVEAYVSLMTRIGEPVQRPWIGLQVVLETGVDLPEVEPTLRAVTEAEVVRLGELQEDLIAGRCRVC